MPGKLDPGSNAPAFKLPRDGGGSVSLADFKGKVFASASPGAVPMTPGRAGVTLPPHNPRGRRRAPEG